MIRFVISNKKFYTLVGTLLVLIVSLSLFASIDVRRSVQSDLDQYYAFEGSLSYIKDEDWKDVIRPLAFDESLVSLDIYSGDTLIDNVELQSISVDSKYHLSFVHDGYGGGGFVVSNIPKEVDGEQVTSVKLRVNDMPFYQDGSTDLIEFSDEVTSVVNTEILLEPYMVPLTIIESVEGEAQEETPTFTVNVKMSNPNNSSEYLSTYATRTVYVTKGSTGATIQVPSGLRCLISQVERDDYAPKHYGVSYIVENGSTDQEINIEINTTKLNPFYADEVRVGKNVKKYVVNILNTARNSKVEWNVVWLDNNSYNRPVGTFKLQFSCEGMEYADVTEDVLEKLGMESMPIYKEIEHMSFGDETRYAYSNLPTIDIEGNPISYKVVQTTISDDYFFEYDAAKRTFYNTIKTRFTATIRWLDSDANPDAIRPLEGQIKKNLRLYSCENGVYKQISVSKNIKITKEEKNDSKWKIEITKDLPQYSKTNDRITYMLIEGTIEEDGTAKPLRTLKKSDYVGEEIYNISYYNEGSTEVVSDRCYNEQLILHILKSDYNFVTTKKWNDDENAVRPKATVTLWRYTVTDPLDRDIKIDQSARVITQDKDGNDLVLQYVLKTSGVKVSDLTMKDKYKETLSFSQANIPSLADDFALPKYDPAGNEYIYFVVETDENEDVNFYYNTVYKNRNGKVLDFGATLGGEIISTRGGMLSLEITKLWNSASAAKNIEGAKVSFKVIGREQGTNTYKELTIMNGQDFIKDFGVSKLRDKTEIIVNPYDSQGRKYEEIIVQEKGITLNGRNVPLTYNAENKDEWTFSMGSDTYEGKCGKLVPKGHSVIYTGVEMYGVNISNTVTTPKKYNIVINWDEDILVEERTGQTLKLVGVSIKNVEEGQEPPKVSYDLVVKNNAQEENGVTRGTAILIDEKGNSVEIGYTESLNEIGSTIWTIDELPGLRMYDSEGYLIDYRVVSVKNDVLPGTTVSWFTAFSTNADGTLIRNTRKDDDEIYVHGTKLWNDGEDTGSRYKIKLVITDPDNESIPAQILYVDSKTFWNNFIKFPEGYFPGGVAKYTLDVKEILVGPDGKEYESYTGDDGKTYITTDKFTYRVEMEQYNAATNDPSAPSSGNILGISVTNTRVDHVDFVVENIWKDGQDQSSTRPKEVTYEIYKYDVYGNLVDKIEIKLDNNNNAINGELWSKTITKLDKYDEYGRRYDYYINEVPVYDPPNSGDYKLNLEYNFLPGKSVPNNIEGYKFGDTKVNDKITYTCTNYLQAKTSFYIYQKWLDKAIDAENRPDMYMTVYKKNTDGQVGPEAPIEESIKNQIWTASDNEDYSWKIEFINLDKYDENGYLNEFYVVQSLNNIEEAGLKYHTEYRDEEYNLLYTNYTEAKGYIVNTLYDLVEIKGEKIWKNVAGFKPEDMPSIIIELYREDPQGNELKMNDVELINGRTEIYFNKQEYDENGEHLDSQLDLQKYTDKGEAYKYYLKERKEDIIAPGECTEGKDGDIYNLFAVKRENNTIINEFNRTTNNRRITITKKWKRDAVVEEEKNIYPSITLKLYRYTRDDVQDILGMEYIGSQTISSNEFKNAENGEYDITFDNLLIYSPRGDRYKYFIQESEISEAYESEYSVDGTTEGITVADNGIHFRDIKRVTDSDESKASKGVITNTFDPQGGKKVQGYKMWNDYFNFYKLRPESIDIELSRGATASDGNNRVPEIKIPIEVKNAEDATEKDKAYVVWDKNVESGGHDTWLFTIYNLPKYAANGQTYQYYVREADEEVSKYYSNSGKISRNMSSINSNNVLLLGSITNKFTETHTIKKHWIDGNNMYNFRPKEVTMELEYSSDNGLTWSKMLNQNGSDEVLSCVLTRRDVVANTRGNTWRGSFSNLPSHMVLKALNQEKTDLVNRVWNLENGLISTQETVVSSTKQVYEDKKSKVSSFETSYNNAIGKLEAANTALEKAQKDYEAARKVLENAEIANETAKNNVEAAQEALLKAQEELAQKNSDHVAAQAAVDVAQAKLDEAEEQLAVAKKKYNDANKEFNDANDNIEYARTTLEAANNALETATNACKNAQDDLKNAITDEEKAAAQQALAKQQQQLEAARKQVDEAQKNVKELEEKIDTASDVMSTANAEIDTANTAVTNAKNELKDLETAEQEANVAVTEVTAELAEATSALADAKTAQESAESALADAKTAYNSAIVDVNTAKTSVESAQNIHDAAEAELNLAIGERDLAKAEYEAAEAVLATLKAELIEKRKAMEDGGITMPTTEPREIWEDMPLPVIYRFVETKLGNVEIPESRQVGSYVASQPTVNTAKKLTEIKNSMQSTKITVTKVWDDVDNYYQTRFNKTHYKLQRIAQYAIPQESSSGVEQGPNNLVTRPMPEDKWEQVYDIDGKPLVLELTDDDICKDENGAYNWWKNTFYNLPVAREGDINAGEPTIVKLYYRVVECTNDELNPELVTVNQATDGTYSIDATKTYKHYRDVTYYNMSWKYDETDNSNISLITNHMITKEDVNEENGTNLVSEIAAEKRWAKDTNVSGYNVEIELKRRKNGSNSYTSFPKAIKKVIYYNGEGVSWNNMPAYNEDGVSMFYRAEELTENSNFKVHTEVITSDIETGQKELYKFTNIQLMKYTVRAYWYKNDRLLPTSEKEFVSISLLQQRITDTGQWETMKYDVGGADRTVTLRTTYRETRMQTATFSEMPKYTVDNKRIYYRAVETHINGVLAEENKAYITSNVDAELNGDVYTDDGITELYHTLRTENLNVTKNWDDDYDCDNVRPRINDKSKMNLTVYADLGSGYTVVPASFYTLNWRQDGDNKWIATISNLPKYNKTGSVLIKYKLVETTIPYRYFISRDFEVPEFKDEVDEYHYSISNTLTLLLRLKKYDEVSGAFLTGTQFKLYKFDSATGWFTKQIGSTLTVGADGFINFQMDQAGDFMLIESKAVKGYEWLLDKNGEPDLINGSYFQCYFTIQDNNLRQTLQITNELTKEIEQPSPDDYAEPSAVSNEAKESDFTAAVVPYKQNVSFGVIKGWYNQVTDRGLANKRKLGELTFSKRDENTARKLNGIVFALYRYENENGTGNPVYVGDIETGKNYICSKTGPLTITEDATEPTEDGKVHISKLPWGKYWMDEKSTLVGYRFPTGKHTFVVNASTVNDATSINENIVVKYNNSKCIDNVVLNEKTKFRFYKRGYSNCYLTGGTFKIVSNDEARTEQRFWRNVYSDDESKKETVLKPYDWVYGLPVGSYRIVEVDVPYGYKPAPDVVFSINEYGWIVNSAGKNTNDRIVNMHDEAVMVDIINVDEDFITPINGSTFELTGKFANATGSAITSEETRKYTISDFKWALRGNVLPSFPNEEKYIYKLEQIAVPVGYELQPQVVYFIINENYQVELTDKDGNTPNAELAELYELFVKTNNEKGSVPSIIFENLRIPVNDIYILNGETYLDPNSQNICKLFYAYDHVENDTRLGEPIQFWVDKSNLGKLEFAVTTSADGTDKSKYVDSCYITIRDSKGQIMIAEDNMYRLDEDEVYTLEFTSSYLNGIKTGSRMLYLYSHMPRIDDIEGMYIVRRTSFAQH